MCSESDFDSNDSVQAGAEGSAGQFASQQRSCAHELAHEYLARGDAQGWFDQVYRSAGDDHSRIPWADFQANSLMLGQMSGPLAEVPRQRCAVVGCGLGDDAEALARLGFQVTAFDISPVAIDWCRSRWPGSGVDYMVADLLELPDQLLGVFGLVVEINTLQAVPHELRSRMLAPLASLLLKGGRLLLICRSREEGQQVDGPPWALSRSEIEDLETWHGLRLVSLEAITDSELPPKGRFIAVFEKPAAAAQL
jgi:SAM-dependent methyltransferase